MISQNLFFKTKILKNFCWCMVWWCIYSTYLNLGTCPAQMLNFFSVWQSAFIVGMYLNTCPAQMLNIIRTWYLLSLMIYSQENDRGLDDRIWSWSRYHDLDYFWGNDRIWLNFWIWKKDHFHFKNFIKKTENFNVSKN